MTNRPNHKPTSTLQSPVSRTPHCASSSGNHHRRRNLLYCTLQVVAQMEERNGADLDRGGVVSDYLPCVHADALRDLRDNQTVALHDRGGVVADNLRGVHADALRDLRGDQIVALRDLRDDQTVALHDLRDVRSDVLQVRVRVRIHVDDLQVPHDVVQLPHDAVQNHQTSINRWRRFSEEDGGWNSPC